MARVSLFTLGCRLNQFESDTLAADLVRMGHHLVEFGEPCDLAIVNSCTVTARADRKSRQAVYRALRRGRRVILTGCFAENPWAHLPTDPRLVVVPNTQKESIALMWPLGTDETALPGAKDESAPAMPPWKRRSRGTVKIQDGCDHRCAYCIVSTVRGPSRSVPLTTVLEEAHGILQEGMHEIVLTGVNVGAYCDGDVAVPELVERLLDTPGDFRLRLSSVEPDFLSGELLSLFQRPGMCPHIHLALQSASDRVLKAMGRSYSIARVREAIRYLREINPCFNVTADVIVGFPGETDGDFAETLAFVEEVTPGHVHVFPYSRRPGTAADSGRLSEASLDEATIRERAAALRQAAEASASRFRERLVGRTGVVIVENGSNGHGAEGYTEHYCRLRVADAGPESVPGSAVPVTITESGPGRVLIGTTR